MRDARLARALPIALALFSAELRADSAWTIPGIVNASGLNGTHFVSDLTVTNPGGVSANVTLSFFPAPGPNPKVLTLGPGQTIVSPDVAGVHFGVSGAAGALAISSDQPLLIRAKTYNASQAGTYGVALPVVASERLLAPGDVGDSLWISQDASGSSGSRTNVAVVFPDESGGAATVTVYDAAGIARGTRDFGLDAAGLQQFSVASFAGAVSVGRAEIAVTRGHAAGYAVVVDNVTGDSSLFAFEDVPGGRQDVLVNGVARASGRNGAFFRTDGRFYNPTDTDATIQVAFHANGNANPSPQSASFVVPAGRIRDVVDVLDSLLSLPVGSAGALRFRSDWPVAILCRTSNVDPSGARPGTFGSQQKPVPLLSYVTSADAGAAVTGIRQDAAFRTNVGFAAGADGASYTLTLENATGATVATTSSSLGAFGWTQPGIQDLFPTTTIPENATLRVKVTAGSVDVFDSSIDNLSGDPVVTPIAALPVDLPSSATLGPAGGSIRSDDGRFTLRVPAGALTSPVALSFQAAANDAPNAVGPGFQLLPAGLVFAKPALLVVAYGPGDTDGSSAEALALVSNAGTGWFVFGGGAVDPARRTLTVPLESTSPLPPSSLRAAARSDSVYSWGVLTSWEFSPHGRAAVLTGGQVAVSVKFVGYNSSSISGQGRIFVGSNPADVDAVFLVNGQPVGNAVDGTVVKFGLGGVYTAPACPPPRNPVTISAVIARTGPVAPPYSPRGYLRVRVLNKDWTFKVTWDQIFSCPSAPAADRITYWAGFSFSLDDALQATHVIRDLESIGLFGDPASCHSDEVEFRRIQPAFLTVIFASGGYDAQKDQWNLVLDWNIPTALGYDYVRVGNDGTRFPSHLAPGPVVPIPGFPYSRPEGRYPFHLFLPSVGEANLSVDLEHTGCP